MLKIKIGLEEALVHISWLKEKLYLCSIVEKASKRRVLRGQVYRCKLGIGIGSEENKERPCVILQYNSANHTSPNTIVAPMTRTKSQLPTVAEIKEKKDDKGNVILTGSVLLGNIVCISKARIGDYITTLTKKEMQEIDKAIAFSLGIKHYYDRAVNKYEDASTYIGKLKKSQCTLRELLNAAQVQLGEREKQIQMYENTKNR